MKSNLIIKNEEGCENKRRDLSALLGVINVHYPFWNALRKALQRRDSRSQLTATFPQVWKAVNINIKAIPKIMMLKSFLDSGDIVAQLCRRSAAGQGSQLSSGRAHCQSWGTEETERGGRQSRSEVSRLQTPSPRIRLRT